MSLMFNTGSDRITKEQMQGFARVLVKRTPTNRESLAAYQAIKAFRNGATMQKIRAVFQSALDHLEQR